MACNVGCLIHSLTQNIIVNRWFQIPLDMRAVQIDKTVKIGLITICQRAKST